MVADNSAGRLLKLLRRANEVRRDGKPRQVWLGWAKVFDLPVPNSFPAGHTLPPATQIEILSRLSAMLNLINNLDKELSSIEGLPERYRRLVTRISRVFQVHDLTADFHTALNQLGEGDLDLLEECQEKLAHYRPEEVADQQALEDLWQDVTALYEEIMVAPLDRELKEFILGQLESIRRAIHEYRVGGIERLRSALATNLGELFLHKELLQKYKENEFLRKTVMFSYKLGSIVTFGADLTTMIGNVAPHILRLTSGGLS